MNPSTSLPKGWLALWTALVVLFIMAPLVVVVLVSVTPNPYISLPVGGFSLQWYAKLMEQKLFVTATVNSLLLALQASATALVLGVLTSLAIVRYSFRLRSFINMVASAPLFVPMVLSGLAILVFFSDQGWRDQGTRLYVAHVGITLPYVIRTVTASLSGFDMNQELAARNLGAGPLKAFWYVTIPQVGPGLLAGALFALIASFDNVAISIFLAGSKFPLLPVELSNYASYNNDPMAAALSVVMILFSTVAIALVERLFGVEKLLQA